jgi:predicted dehydrogenase
MNENENASLDFNRRDFLKTGSAATLATMLGGVELFGGAEAAAPAETKVAGPKIKVGVIGLGAWGREILNELAKLEQADVAAICDNYPASLKRSANAAPNATQTPDYNTILANGDIKAVVVATPTHLHKDITLAALKAGKHVYCEAPLASTIEDARTIAQAAQALPHLGFQAGFQLRSDKQRRFLLPFIRSGALGQSLMARAQWHKKQSWRATSPNPEREKALNWRLDKNLSLGLVGELGCHQLDQASWFFNAHPISITGFSNIAFWKDGRDVPDTVQAMVEFPGDVYLYYDATLANSFDSDYEMFYGSDAAIMLRGSKAWMFKEVDSPLLGWEVYAKKDIFYKETGIALVANASKSVQSDQKGQEIPFANASLAQSLDNFIRNAADLTAAAAQYVESYGSDDPKAMIAEVAKTLRRPFAGPVEAFQATVMGIKAHEAVSKGGRLEIKPEIFELG